eukprot:3276245-Rhodomonas_salina.2
MRSERARTNSLSPNPLFLWIVAMPDYKVCAATVEKQSYATLLLASLTLLIVIPTLVVAVVTFVRVNSKDCPLAGATTIQLDTPVPTAPNTPEPSEGDDGHGEPTGDHAAAHWGYSGDIAPDMWGELSPDWSTCSTGMHAFLEPLCRLAGMLRCAGGMASFFKTLAALHGTPLTPPPLPSLPLSSRSQAASSLRLTS